MLLRSSSTSPRWSPAVNCDSRPMSECSSSLERRLMNIVPPSKPSVDVVSEVLSFGLRCVSEPTTRACFRLSAEEKSSPLNLSEVKMGEIALYHADRGLTAHRAVGIRKESGKASVFLTRGEAAGSTEEAVQGQEVLGKVVALERNSRSTYLGGRWAKLRYRARSSARLERHRGATSGGVHGAGVFLLVAALVAVFPSAARAVVRNSAPISSTSQNAASPCSVTINLGIGSPNALVFSLSGINASSILSPTISPSIPGIITLTNNPGNPGLGMWYVPITGARGMTTITMGFSSASGPQGYVCGAVAFSGVSTVQAQTGATGTNNAPTCPMCIGTTGAGGLAIATLSTGGGMGAGAATLNTPRGVSQWSLVAGGPANGRRRGAAAILQADTTTVAWTLANSQAWKIFTARIIPLSATEVQPTTFTVTQQAGQNLIQLNTGREVSSLGFNLYREQNGARVRLNSSLLAGTALLAGNSTTLTAGHIHTWWDAPTGDGSGVAYSVEEVDLHGQHTWYGPETPKPAQPESGGSVGSTALTTATATDAWGRAVLLSRVGREVVAPGTGVGSASHPLEAHTAPTINISQNTQRQYALAAGHAVKLGVESEGWYRVAWPDLVA